jgi:hypothetical protein
MSRMKLWHWLFVASVGLNVFLGSAAIIHMARGPKGPPGPPPPGGIIMDMASRLSQSDADILMHAWKTRTAEAPPMPEMREQFERMDEAIAADPFDLNTFRQALDEFRENRQTEGLLIGQALTDALPLMSLQGRRKLTEHPHGPPPPR